ncbi:Cna B-type domain-containing protein [Oribacterium sp. WCC10]|uniref:Cna B-type domain-containing protein n=1 Tax=Oribacterium sp. WCC10 TaxID=1855343 RepID=UPI0008F1D319|nr:Cna B-type domain-containing protein [Oribacterium sp. WCC10]SFG45530.1 hypothetical protein SAMN05216356_10964 [Oribacterium sp. WCC10]
MNKLTKQLLSLVLCVLMVIESGFNAGLSGYAMESSAVHTISSYAVKVLADLPEDVAYQAVEFGTPKSKIELPKTMYALACDAEAEIDEDADVNTENASASEVDDEEISTASTATRSIISKSIDFITDDQKEAVKKLLSGEEKPSIREIEDETGLDLTGYTVIKLPLSWESDESFGGEYNPKEAGVYRFAAIVKNETKYVLFDSELPTISVEVMDEDAQEFSATWSDDDVEITVKAPAGVFPNDSSLKVEKITKDSNNLKIDEAVGKALDDNKIIDNTFSYDIKVVNADNEELDPVTEGDRKVNITFKSKAILDVAESEDKYVSVYHFKDIDKEDVEKAAKADDDKDTWIENVVDSMASFFGQDESEEKLEVPELIKAEEPDEASVVDEKPEDAPESDDSINVSADGELSVNTEDFSVYTIAFYSDKANVKGYYVDLSSESFSVQDGDLLTVELSDSNGSIEDVRIAAKNLDIDEDQFKSYVDTLSGNRAELEAFLTSNKKDSANFDVPADTALGLVSDSDGISLSVNKLKRNGKEYSVSSTIEDGEKSENATHKSVYWSLNDTFYVEQTTTDLTGDVTYELSGFGSNGGKATIVITDKDGNASEPLIITSENDEKKEFSVAASAKSFTVVSTDILSISPKEYQNPDYTIVSDTGDVAGQVMSNISTAPTKFDITNVKTYAYSVGQNITKGGETFVPADNDDIVYSLEGLNANEQVIVRTEDGDNPYPANDKGEVDITVPAKIASFSIITKSEEAKIASAAADKEVNNIVLATDITDEKNLSADQKLNVDYIVPALTVKIIDEKGKDIEEYTSNNVSLNDPDNPVSVSGLYNVNGHRYIKASLKIGNQTVEDVSLISDFNYKTTDGTGAELTGDAELILVYAEMISYPIYLKVENVAANQYIKFKVDGLDTNKVLEAYLLDSKGTESKRDVGSKNTFTVKVKADQTDYYLVVKSDDEDLSMYIVADGTKYQIRTGIGVDNAVNLLRKQENSDKKENQYYVEGRSTNETVKKLWEDGGETYDEKKKVVDGQDVHSLMYLEYYLDDAEIPGGRTWKKLDSDAMQTVLGYTAAQSVTVPAPSATNANTSSPTEYIYTFASDLFANYVEVKVRDGGKGSEIGKTVPIKYRLAEEDELKKHYFSRYEDENGNEDSNGTILRNYKIQTFTATIQWNDIDALKDEGGNNVDRPSIDKWYDYVELYKVVKGDDKHPATLSFIWKDKEETDYVVTDFEETAASVVDNHNGTWTIKVKGYAYSDGNYNVHYYLKQKNIELLAEDVGVDGNTITNRRYEPIYNNVGNASNKINGVYDGGTLVNILAGDTQYVMYKLWKDEATDEIINNRPTPSVLIYRYARTNEDRWTYRAPIQDQVYEVISEQIGEGDDEYKQALLASGALAAYDNDVTNRVYKLVLPKSGVLSAYNGDGVQLVYIGKEHTEGGSNRYVRSLIRRANSENPNDTKLHGGQFILNGETLINLITDQVTVKATKTWQATARQDVDAEVELKLYSTLNSEVCQRCDADDPSVNLVATEVLKGFSSEQKSRSHSWSMDKYDAEGRRLYYFVKEGFVRTKVGSDFENATEEKPKVDGPTYYLTDDGYRYVQEVTTNQNTDGNVDISITNRLVGNAQIKVTKRFKGGISQIDADNGEAKVNFDVFQNNNKIGVISKTYKEGSVICRIGDDGQMIYTPITDLAQLKTDFTDVIIVDRYDDDNDAMTLTQDFSSFTDLLPRYDPNGAEYTYSVFEHRDEAEAHGYYPTYQNKITEAVYTTETSDTDIRPHIKGRDKYLIDEIKIENGTGADNYITVYKEWLDGEESEKRQSVSFVLQHKKEGENAWVTVSTPSTIDPTAKEYSKYSFMEIPESVKKEFIDWRGDNRKEGEKYSPYNGSGDFRVIETHVGKNEVHYYTGKVKNTVVDDVIENCDNDREKYSLDYEDYYLGHDWNQYNGVKASFSDLQKVVDEDGNKYEDDDYGFVQGDYFDYDVLICNSKSAKGRYVNYQYTEDGNVIGNRNFDFAISNVRVGVIYIDIEKEWVDGRMAGTARPDSLKLQIKIGEKTKYEETKTVELTSPATGSNIWTAKLGPLRKYDEKGKLINYNPHLVANSGKYEEFIYNAGREEERDKYTNAYVMSGDTTAEFKPGHDHHTGDRYSFAIKNTLAGTITPIVNKFWEDYDYDENDNYKQNKRPDIYVNLYRRYTDGSKDSNGNPIWHCETLDKVSYIDYDWETIFDIKTHNWWQVRYNPQSRFTSDFYEYEYYIGETYASENTNEYAEIGAFQGSPKYTDDTHNVAIFPYEDEDHRFKPVEIDGKTVVAARVALDEDNAGTLVNRPRNKRTVKGVKIYELLPTGYSNKNLPDIELELWRRPYGEPKGSNKEEKVPEYDITTDLMGQEDLEKKEGTNLVAVLKGANELYKRNFTFYKGNKTEDDSDKVQAYVPKYDDTGRPYTYFVKEADTYSILGAKGDADTEERIKVLHATYDFEVVPDDTLTNGIKAVNKYKETRNYSVKFYKKWDGFDPENDYDKKYLNAVHGNEKPQIIVRLYRYLQDSDGNIINGTGELIDEDGVLVNKNLKRVDENGKEIGDYTEKTLYYDSNKLTEQDWSNLVYYAPNLNPYKYVVSEKAEEEYISNPKEFPYTRPYDVYRATVETNGSSVDLKEAKINSQDDKPKPIKTGEKPKVTFDDTTTKDGKSTMDQRTVVRHDSKWYGYDVEVDGSYNLVTHQGNGNAGIINKYRKDRFPLKILKVWSPEKSDYDGIEIIPNEIEFTLYRLYDKGSLSDKEKIHTFKLKGDEWIATTSQLLKYEPTRGLYYRYYVEEEKRSSWNGIEPFVIETEDNHFWNSGKSKDGSKKGVVYPDGGVDGTNPKSGVFVDENNNVITVTGRKNVFKTIDLHAVKKFKNGNNGEEISPDNLKDLYKKNAIPKSITYRIYYQIQDGKQTGWTLLTKGGTPVSMDSDSLFNPDDGTYSLATKTGLLPYAYDSENDTYREIKYRAVEYSVKYPGGEEITRTEPSIANELSGKIDKTTGFSEFSKIESVYDVKGDIKDKDGKIVEKNPYYFETTVTNTLDLARLDVTKVWDKEVRGFNTKVNSVTFKLQRKTDEVNAKWEDVYSGTSLMEQTIEHDATEHTASFTYLPAKDKKGNAYTYRAVETKVTLKNGTVKDVSSDTTADGINQTGGMVSYKYTAVNGTDKAEGVYSEVITTKATNTYRLGNISVTKNWEDTNNKYKMRPKEIWVKLIASVPMKDDGGNLNQNSEGYTLESMPLNKTNNWKASWSELPICDADGGKITYTLKEYVIDKNNQEVIINSYDATSLIEVEGETEKQGNESNPVTVVEDGTTQVKFTNTIATTSYLVEKYWDTDVTDPTRAFDDGVKRKVTVALNKYQKGQGTLDDPDWVQVCTYTDDDTNGTPVTAVLEESNKYKYEWTDLPARNEDGSLCRYKAVEQIVDLIATSSTLCYVANRAVNEIDGIKFKETGVVGGFNYEAEELKTENKSVLKNILKKGDFSVTKMWDDDKNRDGIRPDKVTFHLQRKLKSDPNEEKYWVTLPEKTFDRTIENQLQAGEGNWTTATWSNLPVQNAYGENFVYRVVEDNADGYVLRLYNGEYSVVQRIINAIKEFTEPVRAFFYKLITGKDMADYVDKGTELTEGEAVNVKYVNIHDLETVDAEVSKVWTDQNDKYGERPLTLEVTLYAEYLNPDTKATESEIVKSFELADGKTVKLDNPVTLNEKNGWKASWSNLPKYKRGFRQTEITYVVKERKVNGYTEEKSETVPVNVNTETGKTVRFDTLIENKVSTTSVIARKYWDTDETDKTDANSEFKRFVNVALQYTSDGNNWKAVKNYLVDGKRVSSGTDMTAVLSKDNDYSFLWDDLPVYDKDGKKLTYRAVETSIETVKIVDGKEVRKVNKLDAETHVVGGYNYHFEPITAENGTFVASLSNILKKGDYTITKVWDDDDDRDNDRPDTVTFHLQRKIDSDADWKTLDTNKFDRTIKNQKGVKTGAWSIATWSDLPVENAEGDAYSYRAVEDAVTFYTPGVHDAATGKVVDAANDKGTNLSEKNTVISTYSNIHKLRTVDITAAKKWDDSDDKYGDRPKNVTVTLYARYTGADGKAVEEAVKNIELADGNDVKFNNDVVLSASNNWTVTWTGLPEYKRGLKGAKITYVVKEKAVDGYTVSIADKHTDGVYGKTPSKFEFVITNKLNPVDIVVRKNWANEFAGIGKGVTGAEVVLQRKTGATDWTNVYETVNGQSSLMIHVINKTDSSWTVTDLPQYDSDGNKYSYRAVESRIILADGSRVNVNDDNLVKGTVGGYVYTSTTEATNTGFRTDITNRMETASLKVSKIWDDENNKSGKRPNEIKVNLKTLIVVNGNTKEISIDGIVTNVTLSANNNWTDTTTWADVPVFTAEGKRIYYVLSEENISGYNASYSSKTYGQSAITGSGIEATSVYLESGQTSEVEFTNYNRTGGGNSGGGSSRSSSSGGSDSSNDSTPPDDGRVLGVDRDAPDGPDEPRVLGANRTPAKTGDMSNMMIYGIVSIFSLAVLGVWYHVYKKKEKHNTV